MRNDIYQCDICGAKRETQKSARDSGFIGLKFVRGQNGADTFTLTRQIEECGKHLCEPCFSKIKEGKVVG